MKIDIRKYIGLRDSLLREKADLEQRLQQINEALGSTESLPGNQGAAPASTPSTSTRKRAGRARSSAGGLSLKDAVLQLTSSRPMTKQEILDGVKQLGYRFSTSNPMNSLGVILYGKNPKFQNDKGKFSPKGSAAKTSAGQSSTSSAAPASSGKKAKGKRAPLSPEARERIAAAQRARWAKANGGK